MLSHEADRDRVRDSDAPISRAAPSARPVSRILAPLAAVYGLGVRFRLSAYRRQWFKTRRLHCPVISVGNLSTGGSGKTPLVAYIARALLKRGWKPSILTRGYGRRRGTEIIPLAPGCGRTPDPRATGDEPALLARALPEVAVVVGANRYQSGLLAESRFNAEVHVLDDGFQHLALARDIDIVALDTTEDWAREALLPAGRLRERLAALERADIVMLTRSELGNARLPEASLRAANPDAQIYHSSTHLARLVEVRKGAVDSPEALRGKPVYACCGVGNPQAFFSDLRHWGFSVVGETRFRDHHLYTVEEIRRLARGAAEAGAAALVITEKDAINFPSRWECDLPVHACAIEIQVRESEAFEAALVARLERSVRRHIDAACPRPL